MTSVLNVDTIADKAGTGPVALTKQFAPKAWVNMDAGQNINNSFNTSSVTDNTTGDHSATWTNVFNYTTYSVATHCRTTTTYAQISTPEGAFTTSTVTINTHQSNSTTKGDKTENGILATGELA